MSETKYRFVDIEQCDFCGSDKSNFKLLGKRLDQAHGKFPKKLKGQSTSIQKCKKCELIFSNPLPIPVNFDDHYGVDPDSYWPQEYFEIDKEYFKIELDELKGLLDFEKQELKALDIGAGIGKCMIAMENVSIQSWGLEPSPTFYKMALDKMKIPSDRLSNNGVEEANYENESFDFITFGAVLEHLTAPSESISQAMKWLKKGGLMHIEVPNSNWFVSRLGNAYHKIFNPGYASNLSPMHPPYHLYEFSHKSFQVHGKKNGYEVAKHTYHVCNTYLPKVLDTLAVPYMEATNSGMQLVIWLRKL